MARSKVGEQGGFMPDEDAVDAMKVTFFVGAFAAYYQMVKYVQENVPGADPTKPGPKTPADYVTAFSQIAKTRFHQYDYRNNPYYIAGRMLARTGIPNTGKSASDKAKRRKEKDEELLRTVVTGE